MKVVQLGEEALELDTGRVLRTGDQVLFRAIHPHEKRCVENGTTATVLDVDLEARKARLLRHLHADTALAWSPMWHWTDQKIAVHAFYCVLALTLLRVMVMRARAAGDQREAAAMIRDLDRVQECTVVYAGAGGRGRHRVVQKVEDTTAEQGTLLEVTGATSLAARIGT